MTETSRNTGQMADAEAGAPDEATARTGKWKRHLLDLSNYNRLLNYRDTSKTAMVLCHDLPALEDKLADGVEFQLLPRWEAPKKPEWEKEEAPDTAATEPTNQQAPEEENATQQDAPEQPVPAAPPPEPDDEFAKKRLRVDIPPEDCGKRLLAIHRDARAALQDSGANLLFLALGFLYWKDPDADDATRRAPLVLLPLEMRRQGGAESFSVRMADDEPHVNATLLEKLKTDMGIDIPGCSPLPHDDCGIDTTSVLESFRGAVAERPGWEVREEAAIGLFSFTKFLMWRDLNDHGELLQATPLVASLLRRTPLVGPESDFPSPATLDRDFSPADTFCPALADSSQLAAVYAAAAGHSFVMDGPPGTGKSQTIVNMIAHCLSKGKTVLFVAEKAAALTVVQQRLRELGLDRFCLELHSRKAQKREVVEQIKNAWEAERDTFPDDWAETCDRLGETRDRLNRHCEALHRRRAIGLSLRDVLSRVIAYRDDGALRKPLPFPWSAEEIAGRDADAYAALCAEARELQAAATATGGARDNPWRDSAFTDWRPVATQRLAGDALDAALAGRTRYAEARETGKHILPETITADFAVAGPLLASLVDHLRRAPGARADAILPTEPTADAAFLNEAAVNAGVAEDSARTLFATYREDFLTADLDSLSRRCRETQSLGFISGFFARRRIRATVLPYVLPGASKPDFHHIHADVDAALRLRDAKHWLAEHADRLNQFFTAANAPTRQRIAETASWLESFRTLLSELGALTPTSTAFSRRMAELASDPAAAQRETERLEPQLAAWENAATAWSEEKKHLAATLAVQPERIDDYDRDGSLPHQIRLWQTNLDSLAAWANWNKRRDSAQRAGLDAVVREHEAGGPAERIFASFDASYLYWWLEGELGRDPELAGYGVTGLMEDVRAIGDQDAAYQELAVQAVRATLSARAAEARDQASGTALSLLRHQFGLKRRFMPIRQLMGQAGPLVRRIMPCFLMSPISAAQYLDMTAEPFDLVIFDEASQIPTADAAGVMARGRQVIVAGDPQQLPPTTFFQRQTSADTLPDEDDYREDLESLLDDCLAAGLPRVGLNWHYRSRNESLIAFSNRRYYGDRLQTFPGPDRTPGIRLVQIDGIYDRSRSRTNTIEAKAVADEVIRRLSDPELSKQSIGVVTLNRQQQTLIEDLLDDARRGRRDLDAFFDDASPSPVLVKNLENVQGDERDVILLSVCYGPDESGKAAMNFGPLNREGGQRRLNVAITRARREVLVFSSLRPDQIDPTRSSARGVADLRAYLEFAAGGPLPPPASAGERAHNSDAASFEEHVAAAVRALGYDTARNVGFSGYRVDIGVYLPDAPDEFILGIECDGENYRSAATARDRDRLRALVLDGLGWTLCRVWSEEWFERRDTALRKLEVALAESQRRTGGLKSAPHIERK